MKFPFLTIIFIVAYLFVGISIVVQSPDTALVGLGVLATFIVIYFLFVSKGKRSDNILEASNNQAA